MDVFALDGLEERFDFVYCVGILQGSRTHSGCCACCVGGRWMAARCCSRPTASARKIETARRSASPSRGRFTRATTSSTGGLGDAGLQRLARIAGFSRAESLINVQVDGHPRILGRLVA
jgi:hypothetical protein